MEAGAAPGDLWRSMPSGEGYESGDGIARLLQEADFRPGQARPSLRLWPHALYSAPLNEITSLVDL
jgi:hypothetical protein